MTRMWKVSGDSLTSISRTSLDNERRLEDWIEHDPMILGLDLLIIGRQVRTPYGGVIDLLALDEEGNTVVLELKRDRTPRETVAQIFDYASWVHAVTTREIHNQAQEYLGHKKPSTDLPNAFRDRFGSTLPEKLNSKQRLLIVASEFDDSSRRIVQYLATVYAVDINTAFFNCFRQGDQEFVTADWLMDEDDVRDRSEARTQAPWSGYWYVNVGDSDARSWEDCRRYGFLAAGGDPRYSDPLKKLEVGAQVFAYQKGFGYVGFGAVTTPAMMAKDFKTNADALLSLPLQQPNLAHDRENPERAEYVVGVEWKKTFPLSEAKTFSGVFANQNIVCKLRHPTTLQFLKQHFSVPD